MSRLTRIYILLIAASVLIFTLALKLGAVSDAPSEIVLSLRLPRVLMAFAIGMGLAVVGAGLQVLFCNPLCEPYTIGVSSGSALGAIIGASLGLGGGIIGMIGCGFIGALIFTLVLLVIASRQRTGLLTLLLTGVMLGFLGSSLVALWMVMMDTNGLQGAIGWLLGDLSRARIDQSVTVLGLVIFLGSLLWSKWRELDALLLGEEPAVALGVDVHRLRKSLLLISSLMVGICVSTVGMIGFVGLVIPHISRKLLGSLHLPLLPGCAILGGFALVLADLVSRTIYIPFELPVGVITSLIGAPVFVFLLLQQRSALSG